MKRRVESAWRVMGDALRGVLERWLPQGSLARRLARRLMPALVALLLVDGLAVWSVAGLVRSEAWVLRDWFWIMMLVQAALVVLFAWVLISGIRRELASINRLADQISQRSIEDLTPLSVVDIPREVSPLVLHLNDLLVRLDDATRAQRRFVGQAAHQLRTPLTGLKLESELMLAQTALPPDVRARAERIKQVSDRMIRLGQQLLVLARADHTIHPRDHFIRLDLCEWLRRTGGDWLARVRAQHCELRLTAPDAPVWIDGDPVLLDELLGNLIDNALRHARDIREISLQVGRNPPSFSVADDGQGVRPDDVSRVFESFYQARPPEQPGRDDSGSGLGLAIVREIARAHGAGWKLRSRPDFPGTRVTIVFPGPRRGAGLNRTD